MKTITLTQEEADLIVETEDAVSQGSWRWGDTRSYVLERDGKNYMLTVRFHVEQGLQDEGPYVCHEVKSVVTETTAWIKA